MDPANGPPKVAAFPASKQVELNKYAQNIIKLPQKPYFPVWYSNLGIAPISVPKLDQASFGCLKPVQMTPTPTPTPTPSPTPTPRHSPWWRTTRTASQSDTRTTNMSFGRRRTCCCWAGCPRARGARAAPRTPSDRGWTLSWSYSWARRTPDSPRARSTRKLGPRRAETAVREGT